MCGARGRYGGGGGVGYKCVVCLSVCCVCVYRGFVGHGPRCLLSTCLSLVYGVVFRMCFHYPSTQHTAQHFMNALCMHDFDIIPVHVVDQCQRSGSTRFSYLRNTPPQALVSILDPETTCLRQNAFSYRLQSYCWLGN